MLNPAIIFPGFMSFSGLTPDYSAAPPLQDSREPMPAGGLFQEIIFARRQGAQSDLRFVLKLSQLTSTCLGLRGWVCISRATRGKAVLEMLVMRGQQVSISANEIR
jgi:hypothetical protein